jgi:hypothetical protein
MAAWGRISFLATGARIMLSTALLLAASIVVGQEAPTGHEKLEKHLGWLIGEWTADVTTADGKVQKASAKLQWTAHEQVIRLDLNIGDWQGLSMIFWDASDRAIKMWGADSGGGNGQATMRVEGDELVWHNTVYDKDGKKNVSEFSYVKENPTTLVVKYTDEMDGKKKRIVNKKKP